MVVVYCVCWFWWLFCSMVGLGWLGLGFCFVLFVWKCEILERKWVKLVVLSGVVGLVLVVGVGVEVGVVGFVGLVFEWLVLVDSLGLLCENLFMWFELEWWCGV